jgi:DNA-binding IclR family transcriptional regulator
MIAGRESDADRADANDTAVDKALTVLEALVEGAPRMSLAAIAARSRLAKPNTHRILQILSRRGYARTDGIGNYDPGPRILALAGEILVALDYASHARPALRALQARVPETIHFGVLSAGVLVYVEKLEGLGAYRMASAVGMQLPLYCTAIGKALLAELPADERDALLAGIPLSPRTTHTKTDRAQLDADLEEIAQLGFAFDEEENEAGVRCVGAPVFSSLGRVVGGVSVSMPAFQLSPETARRIAPDVIEAAAEVSRSLGAPANVVARCLAQAERLRAPAHMQRKAGAVRSHRMPDEITEKFGRPEETVPTPSVPARNRR